jgi:hypothetical protein
MDISQLPPSQRDQVNAELQSGEQITWLDQPIAARLARTSLPAVLFGIPWTIFAIFWVVTAFKGVSQSHDSGLFQFFPLFGVPFILVGIGLLSSPYWAARSGRRTVYVLTDRRAIVLRTVFFGGLNVRSFEAATLTDLQRKQNRDGSGDLIFARDLHSTNRGTKYTLDIGFVAVRDVQNVENLVRALAARSAES